MKDLSFGLTMTFMGMGVTLLTLALLILVIHLMNKIYPYKKEDEEKKK
ncbi:MAG: OadG-related small transporter subunit [Dehalococcoidales bacterium]|nr:OadG-related small transporter subunit [Dehalococcoidales bacterium]